MQPESELLDGPKADAFLAAANKAFAALRPDPEAWAEELEERRTWLALDPSTDEGA